MPSKPRSLAGILHSRRPSDREYNRARRDPALAAIYGSASWQAVRLQVLRDEPCCRECARHGVTELATQVDHVVPLAVDLGRAFDRANCQPLCTAHHAAKSAADRATLSAADRSAGGGGEGHLSGRSLPSGARGTSQFSRVSPLSDAPSSEGQKWPSAGDSTSQAPFRAPAAPEPPLPPAGGLNQALAGDVDPQDGAGACDAKPGVSGGVAPPGQDLGPRDIEAMAVGLALTHGLPVADARARIEAALARGDRVLEVP